MTNHDKVYKVLYEVQYRQKEFHGNIHSNWVNVNDVTVRGEFTWMGDVDIEMIKDRIKKQFTLQEEEVIVRLSYIDRVEIEENM